MIEYLVIPYTHKSKEVENFRAMMSDFIFAELSKAGRTVIAPVTMCHNASRTFGMPTDWKFWQRIDSELLKVCDRLLVVQLPGIENSVGVKAEVELAKGMGKEVIFVDATPFLMKFIETELNKPASISKAMASLKQAIHEDAGYAQSWFANLSVMFQDAGCAKSIADDGANRFMNLAFDKNMLTKKETPVEEKTCAGTCGGEGNCKSEGGECKCETEGGSCKDGGTCTCKEDAKVEEADPTEGIVSVLQDAVDD